MRNEKMKVQRIVGVASVICLLSACGARSHIVATNPVLSLAPTCPDAVPVFADNQHVPYDYYEVDALGATHATVKVVGAALGSNDAERKGRAIAIWMPSDTARVRETCGGKSQ